MVSADFVPSESSFLNNLTFSNPAGTYVVQTCYIDDKKKLMVSGSHY